MVMEEDRPREQCLAGDLFCKAGKTGKDIDRGNGDTEGNSAQRYRGTEQLESFGAGLGLEVLPDGPWGSGKWSVSHGVLRGQEWEFAAKERREHNGDEF